MKLSSIIILLCCIVIPTTSNANLLSNSSFEDGFTSWNNTGFSIASSFTSSYGPVLTPTDGSSMTSITDNAGELIQPFSYSKQLNYLKLDVSLVDPYFGTNNPMDAILMNITFKQDENIIHTVSNNALENLNTWDVNNWKTLVFPLADANSNLSPGETYSLSVYVSPNFYYTIPEIGWYPGTGTTLIDNVNLTTTPLPSSLSLLAFGLLSLARLKRITRTKNENDF